MGEVRYSINGKYFKDYGIYVSSSLGLLDALKRKPIKTYDWLEYHGESLDLSNPKFEAREIVLNCFIKGENYQQMFDNFRNVVLSEFQKSGTQRLLVEPFGYKALPFEVYLSDEVKIAKEFSESTSIGVFSIKLIEPNPIKKVLYTTSNTLNLSYNSSKETEIFFVNGEKTTARGNVSLSGKTLANRVVSGYAFSGRNLLLNTKSDWQSFSGTAYGFVVFPKITSKINETFTARVFVRNSTSPTPITLEIHELDSASQRIKTYSKQVVDGVAEKTITTESTNIAFLEVNLFFGDDYGTTTYQYEYSKPKLEKGNKATDWTPAPEDEKYIIIAGDIDGITYLTTNATVLWEKL